MKELKEIKIIYVIYQLVMMMKERIRCFFSSQTKELRSSRLKNKFKGKRCFIIATGPSLTIEDLELIKGEYSFGVNSIINTFDKTDWRPNFYLMTDRIPYNNLIDRVYNNQFEHIFFPKLFKNKTVSHIPININYYPSHKYRLSKKAEDSLIPSINLDKYFNDSSSVVFTAIQLAVYMGFEQICFLGQDCDYSKNIQHSQITQTNYGTNINSSVGNDILVSFSNYAKYYKEKGVKLINCTRGGKLDCIDRKELEDVLKTSK